jgi:hypothetical protein
MKVVANWKIDGLGKQVEKGAALELDATLAAHLIELGAVSAAKPPAKDKAKDGKKVAVDEITGEPLGAKDADGEAD